MAMQPPLKAAILLGVKMKTIFLFALIFASSAAFADTYVQGYTKSNGTYVQGYYRSDANSIRSDNYSSQGNTNPYTGERGTQRNEYSNPPQYNNGYNNGEGRQLNDIFNPVK
jgi:hypothetical protein